MDAARDRTGARSSSATWVPSSARAVDVAPTGCRRHDASQRLARANLFPTRAQIERASAEEAKEDESVHQEQQECHAANGLPVLGPFAARADHFGPKSRRR